MSLAMLPLRIAALVLPMLVCTIVALAAHGGGLQSVTQNSRGERAIAIRRFEAKVRPLLEKHCIPCHGPTAAKAGLRLDTKMGYATPGIVIPGSPKASLLIQRVRASTNQMPPGGHLSSLEVDALNEWISTGAIDPRDIKQLHADS